jgi:hypothetical protein
MNPKTVARYLRESFTRKYKKNTGFLGMFSQTNQYLFIRADRFNDALERAMKLAGNEERDIQQITYSLPPKYVRVPKYVQPELPLEKPVRQLELPNADVVQGLMNLGYLRKEIIPVVSQLSGDTETQMFEALRRLAK